MLEGFRQYFQNTRNINDGPENPERRRLIAQATAEAGLTMVVGGFVTGLVNAGMSEVRANPLAKKQMEAQGRAVHTDTECQQAEQDLFRAKADTLQSNTVTDVDKRNMQTVKDCKDYEKVRDKLKRELMFPSGYLELGTMILGVPLAIKGIAEEVAIYLQDTIRRS